MEPKEEQQLLNDIMSIKQELLGYNGTEGLCAKVNRTSKEVTKLWIAVATLTASIGGGAYGLIQLFIS